MKNRVNFNHFRLAEHSTSHHLTFHWARALSFGRRVHFDLRLLRNLLHLQTIRLYCSFVLGYLEQGLLVRDAKKLRQHYFSTSHWRLDLLSMLPTDFAYFWWGPNKCSQHQVPCAVIVRINRLLRLPRMWEWFERTETATGYPNAFRICKVSVTPSDFSIKLNFATST